MSDLSSSNLPDSVIQFDPGVKQYFYQAAAPTGWTIDTALGNAVLAVHGSSSYAGSGGGGEQRGTWTQPDHDHTYSGTTDVWSSGLRDEGGGSNTATPAHSHTYNGTTDPDATVNTWRPFANVGIIATKD